MDIFADNDKVKRSNPRKVLWTFKEEAKRMKKGKEKRYRVWDHQSKMFLIDNDERLVRNVKFVTEAPVRERWQLVSSTFDYPYLYVADDLQDKITA